MANSADPDQLASEEAKWSGSTLFAKAGYIRVQQDNGLTFTTLLTYSADDILKCFSYFSLENRIHANCLQWRLETICMKCQIQFTGKNTKKYFKLSAENFTQSAKR